MKTTKKTKYIKLITIILLAVFAPMIPILYAFTPYIISCESHGVWVIVPIVLLIIMALICYGWVISKFYQSNFSKNIKILFIVILGLYGVMTAFGSTFAGAVGASGYCHPQSHDH